MKNRFVFSLAVFVFFSNVILVHAQETKPHSFTVTPEVSYITYKEKSVNVKETGVFYGLIGSYTYRGGILDGAEPMMLKAEGRLSLGDVEYDGQLSDGTPYKIDGVKDVLIELRGLAGFDFDIFSSTTITPFTGIGYRFLSDNLSKDPAGYRRFSNYLYSPIGFETKTPFNDDWAAGISLEYDVFWLGKQYSNLSDYSSAYSDVANDQKSGYGLRASFKLSKQTDTFNILVEPYFIYWDIDKSEDASLIISGAVRGIAYEPQNTSTEFGAKVGVEF